MIATLCVSFLLPAAVPNGTIGGPSPGLVPDTKALYMEHCASCHGDKGDGQGTADLDRSARSFLDGGYSYGNTEKAVVRSIVHGIPGTPMPAFGKTLEQDNITALANYVIALGPPGTVVAPGSSVLTVGDKPVVVTGMMPALKQGGRRVPRSLVVGFPNGTTFQYNKGTAELQAVRQGNFLDRRDWGGRGGAALEPLGKIAWQPESAAKGDDAGNDGQFHVLVQGERVSRSIKGSRIVGDQVWLNFDIEDADGKDIGGGQELIRFFQVDGVPVAMRWCSASGVAGEISVDVSGGKPVTELKTEGIDLTAIVTELCPGLFAMTVNGDTTNAILIHTPAWTDAVERALRAELKGER